MLNISLENHYTIDSGKADLSFGKSERPTFPIALLCRSLTAALKHFQSQLTEYEQEEIMDYSEIWYLGLDTKKIEGCQGSAQNSGYDDEHGSYLKVTSESVKEWECAHSKCMARCSIEQACVFFFFF